MKRREDGWLDPEMMLLRFLVPISIVAASGLLAAYLIKTRPEPERRSAPPAVISVQAKRIEPAAYQVIVSSQGTVRARTESTLIPEVSGKIIRISEAFRGGGFFEEGETLVVVEPSDYETAVVDAEAVLAQAKARIEVEQAQAEQARENWRQLGEVGEPSSLALREPQLAEARAAVASAEARLAKARRDLERTRIAAPYAGRVLEQRVDVGQFVTTGTVLAVIYAVDYAEIRLPLTNEELAFVDLPELYRGDQAASVSAGPKVRLRGTVGGMEARWAGRIVRTEGAIDVNSRQLFVIAQVDDPYGRTSPGQPPLKVGLFVNAEIEGRVLPNAYVLPRFTVREGREILIIDEANQLRRRPIEIVWSDPEQVVVREGLQPGELLCLTPLTFAVDGVKVAPDIEGEARGEPGAGERRPGSERKRPPAEERPAG